MEVRKPFTKFNLMPFNQYGPIGSLSFLLDCLWNIVKIYTQKPPYPCIFKHQKSGSFRAVHHVYDILPDISKNPREHIKKVNTDIRCHSSGFGGFPFPRSMIPVPSAGDICKIDIVNFSGRTIFDLIPEGN